ncbi:MAG TPA: hypothetical protein VGQ00_00225 [Candidatus Norongarragalinales archaeon]|jgi:hypothetical protein|nr:hypothetical protein [Candidatus Norongarragalinales archaeon]
MTLALIIHSNNPDGERIARALQEGLEKSNIESKSFSAENFAAEPSDIVFVVATHDFLQLDDNVFRLAQSGVLKGKSVAPVIIDAGLGKKASEKLKRVLEEHGAIIAQELSVRKKGALRGIGGKISNEELLRSEAFARKVVQPFTVRVRREKEKERISGYKKQAL